MTAEYFLKVEFKVAFLVPLVSVNQNYRIYADNDKKTRRLCCMEQEFGGKSFDILIGKSEVIVVYSIKSRTLFP